MSTVEKGFIFVLTNPRQPHLVLIGAGADHPERALREGFLDDPRDGMKPDLRYAALVEDLTVATRQIDKVLATSDFGTGYFEGTTEQAIAAIRKSETEILYEEVIAAGTSSPQNSQTHSHVDPSQQLAVTEADDPDLWQKEVVRVNKRPRSWGPMPRSQRPPPQNSYRSNIKDRQARKQNALRKLAAAVDGDELREESPLISFDNGEPINLGKKGRRRRQSSSGNSQPEAFVPSAKQKNSKTGISVQRQSGDTYSEVKKSARPQPIPEEKQEHQSASGGTSGSKSSSTSNENTKATATPNSPDDADSPASGDKVSAENGRAGATEEDTLNDISVSWLWQRQNSVNNGQDTNGAVDNTVAVNSTTQDAKIDNSDGIHAESKDNLANNARNDKGEYDAESKSPQVAAPQTTTEQVTQTTTRRTTATPESNNQPKPDVTVPKQSMSTNESSASVERTDAAVIKIPGGKNSTDQADKPANHTKVPPAPPIPAQTATPSTTLNGNSEKLEPQLTVPDPAATPAPGESKQPPDQTAPKQFARDGQEAVTQSAATQTQTYIPPPPQISDPSDISRVPLPRHTGTASAVPDNEASNPGSTTDVQLEAQPGSKPATTTNPAVPPPTIPRPEASTTVATDSAHANKTDTNETQARKPPSIGPAGAADTQVPSTTAKAANQALAARPASTSTDGAPPPRMNANEIASWVQSQDKTLGRRTGHRRAMRWSMLGVPLGAVAGAGYLMANPGLPQVNNVSIIVGAIAAGMVVCYLLARLLVRAPKY